MSVSDVNFSRIVCTFARLGCTACTNQSQPAGFNDLEMTASTSQLCKAVGWEAAGTCKLLVMKKFQCLETSLQSC